MGIWEDIHGLAIRDEIHSAEGRGFQPPKFDRYPTYVVLVWGPSGGKYSSVHYGVSSHTNEVPISDSCFLLRNMVNWICSEQPDTNVFLATVTHTATSWPEYHRPGSHNVWLFYFCQVCLAEKRHVWWEGWVCSLLNWKKEHCSKGQLYVLLQSFLLPAIHWVFSGDQRTLVMELRRPVRGGVGSGKLFICWGNWATSWAPHPVWIFLAYFQLKL